MLTKEEIAYIGLGSNQGDRKKFLCQAIDYLGQHTKIKLLKLSHFYQTEALTLKGEKQNSYLNAVLQLRTPLNAVRLLRILQNIEIALGRVRTHRWAPRKIDLDLLFFGNEIIRSKELQVPHPEAHLRRFVLEPLVEIAPKLIHPVKGLSSSQLLQNLLDDKKVIPLYQFQISDDSQEVFQLIKDSAIFM